MDQVIEYIHDQTGGKALGTKKMTAAGYDTYLYKVTGASKDFRGNSVEGSYRVACILNSDNSELILLCEYDVTDGESEQKALTDLDYILESATATSKKNIWLFVQIVEHRYRKVLLFVRSAAHRSKQTQHQPRKRPL